MDEPVENRNIESAVFGANLSPKDITQIMVKRMSEADEYKDMERADKYYAGKNIKISEKTRKYYDKDSNTHENPNASNAKLKSKFLRQLVQQKQDYGFAKSFNLKLSNETEKEIDLDEDDYGKEWQNFLDNELYTLAYVLAGQAVNHGIAWGYVWINENGELKITDVSSNSIYPMWVDSHHTKLDRLLHHYYIEKYESLSPTNIEYAEYWSDKERILYDVTNGYNEIAVMKDAEGNFIRTHMTENMSWDRIPFVAFKGTDDEKTLLSFIEEHIDTYDELDSKSADALIDDLEPLLVLKGITPEVSSLLEAREIAKMTRTMSLDTDGDAKYVQAQSQVVNYITKMEKIAHDIYKFGYGVNTEDARFSGNPNQIVIKSLYQDLDTYTDGLERHFQDFINDFKYFFDKWYELTGKGSFDECQKYKVLIKLDRSMLMNQSAQIEDSVKLGNAGVSKRTQLEFNPVVQDVDMELERLEEEQAEQMKQQMEMFNFENESKEETLLNKENKKPLEEEKNG